MNYQTTKEELTTLFAEVGEVVDVYLPMDRATGRPRGFAFVEFASDEEAKEAIEKFDGHELGGRNLKINPAEDKPRRPPRAPAAPGGDFGFDPFGKGSKPFKNKGSRRGLRGKKRSL